jgi:GAF domain
MFNSILGSILRVWLTVQARRALDVSRPRGALQVHAVGPDADRILLVIDRPSAGEGWVSQELGFAGHLARRLSALSGRGTDLNILSNGNMKADERTHALAALDLARFDAIVLMIGASEALTLTPARTWAGALTMLLDDIEDTTPAGLHTFVVAVPPVRSLIDFPRPFAPMVRLSIGRLNAATEAACATRSRSSHLLFDPPSAAADGRNSSADFKHWAGLIAPAIHAKVDALGEPQHGRAPADEATRQRSLDDLHVVDSYPSPRIDRLVASARNLFGTTAAAVTLLDHDRRCVKSAIGTSSADTPRVGSLCDLAIAQPGVFFVQDTNAEPRLVRLGDSTEDVRFYAGYPIEAPNGHRIGVLCIMDAWPRTFSHSESALLRELALQVQAELWST